MAGLCEGGNEPAGSLKVICEIDGVCVCDIPLFKYARLTSCDVERSFSQYKSFRDNRYAFVLENLEMIFVVHCNSRPTTSTQVWLFKVCHGSLYDVMWLTDEPREFNLPTFPQRRITYVQRLPSKFHSEEYLPIRTKRIPNLTGPVDNNDVTLQRNRSKTAGWLSWRLYKLSVLR
ncbi:hypothetical protein ANN_18215 [Periplaneta americana]|uniref:Uncharacterized protein n=1 Tax=Periplaneta americana TaxID=6978 RepID=A0ABQ8SN46_PERAM|nr:hypothetical protein ANN_18215 [Periplaneta americana]